MDNKLALSVKQHIYSLRFMQRMHKLVPSYQITSHVLKYFPSVQLNIILWLCVRTVDV